MSAEAADLIARANIAVYLVYVPPLVKGLGVVPAVLSYYGQIPLDL